MAQTLALIKVNREEKPDNFDTLNTLIEQEKDKSYLFFKELGFHKDSWIEIRKVDDDNITIEWGEPGV